MKHTQRYKYMSGFWARYMNISTFTVATARAVTGKVIMHKMYNLLVVCHCVITGLYSNSLFSFVIQLLIRDTNKVVGGKGSQITLDKY